MTVCAFSLCVELMGGLGFTKDYPHVRDFTKKMFVDFFIVLLGKILSRLQDWYVFILNGVNYDAKHFIFYLFRNHL